ncbi:MAG: hypothetical protein UR94_C0013G0037 [Parcubacteria group bacterium GW2011_GWA2_36_10]|nr:MAG: hypothetical protein UR94_C0013G0037 [Parcubacteria group bacterium GW2011_GWA2_36_10]
MKRFDSFKVFYKDRLNFYLLNITILAYLLSFIWLSITDFVQTNINVLHYNIYFGFDVIAPWYWLILLPIFFLLASVLNTLLAWYFFSRKTAWSHFLVSASFLLSIAIFFYLFNILNYNL